MNINRNNYEAYLLDALEGNLSEGQLYALELFFKANPDLDATMPEPLPMLEFEEQLSDQEKKSLLYESIDERNRAYFFIAYVEGVLSNEQKQGVDLFLKNTPQYQDEFEQYKRTTLPEDDAVYFEYKNELVKSEGGIIPFYRYAFRAAAMIIVLLAIGYLLNLNQGVDQPLYTKKEMAFDTIENQTQLESVKAVDPSSLGESPLIHVAAKEDNELPPMNQNTGIPHKNSGGNLNLAEQIPVQEVVIDRAQLQPSIELNPPVQDDLTITKDNESHDGMINAQNDVSLNEPVKSNSLLPIDKWALQRIEDRTRRSLEYPEEVAFENSLYAMASIGLTALAKEKQAIGKVEEDFRKTKLQIGGVKFERSVFVGSR